MFKICSKHKFSLKFQHVFSILKLFSTILCNKQQNPVITSVERSQILRWHPTPPHPILFFFFVLAVLRQSLESLAGVVYCSQNYLEVGFGRAWLPKLIIEGDTGRTVSCEVNEQWSTERLMSFQVSSSPFFLMLISLPPSPAICFCSLVCTDCIWK